MTFRVDKTLPDFSLRKPAMLPGMPPLLKFYYTFNFDIATVARATMLQHNWETRTRLTTVEHVQQLDDDRVVFYRRKVTSSHGVQHWEQVVIDRSNMTVTASKVGENLDKSMYTSEKLEFVGVEGGEKTCLTAKLYDVDGDGAGKVDAFKNTVARMIKATQFDKWSQEEKSE